MLTSLFTAPDTWLGGHFELSMELGKASDARLFQALQVIWSHPNLTGCYLSNNKEPVEQEKIKPEKDHIQSGFHLYGVATLPNEIRVACGTHSVRETSSEIDWLTLYISMGALDIAYNVGSYPFVEESSDHVVWIVAIEKWFNDIAQRVFRHVAYKLALIGFEVSGYTYASEVVSTGIPDVRRIGYLWAEKDRLGFYPANSYQ